MNVEKFLNKKNPLKNFFNNWFTTILQLQYNTLVLFSIILTWLR